MLLWPVHFVVRNHWLLAFLWIASQFGVGALFLSASPLVPGFREFVEPFMQAAAGSTQSIDMTEVRRVHALSGQFLCYYGLGLIACKLILALFGALPRRSHLPYFVQKAMAHHFMVMGMLLAACYCSMMLRGECNKVLSQAAGITLSDATWLRVHKFAAYGLIVEALLLLVQKIGMVIFWTRPSSSSRKEHAE